MDEVMHKRVIQPTFPCLGASLEQGGVPQLLNGIMHVLNRDNMGPVPTSMYHVPEVVVD